jgi:predicted SAM-dependent methyltransferase
VIRKSLTFVLAELGLLKRRVNLKLDERDDRELYLRCFPEDSIANRRFYNISAGGHFCFGGGFSHPYWTNIDFDRPWPGTKAYDPRKDIAHDLMSMTPLPLPSDSAELVHCRYSIEHLTDEAAGFFFREARRVLKPDGILRLVTPDMELDFRAYRRGDRSFFYWQTPDRSIEDSFLTHFAASLSVHHHDGSPTRLSDEEFRRILDEKPFEEAMDIITSRCSLEKHAKNRDDHISWWTHGKLDRMLREAGFETAYASAAEQSSCPVMRNRLYFDNQFQRCMMYMEAVKDRPSAIGPR